jgi:hypothetical protein
MIIVFRILKEHGPAILILGLSLCTLSNWFLFYSDKLMPDMYVTLSVIWALAVIHRYKFKSDKSKPGAYGFLLALSLLFGFMSKGTIVLVLPLLIFMISNDILRKRDKKFWAYSLLSGAILMSLYLLIIWLVTGNLLKRFEAIADNSYLDLCSYDRQSLKILLRRVFLGFFELSVYQSLAVPFVFIFATVFQKKGLRIFRMEDAHTFFMSAAVILFLSCSFMTISATSYVPMCLDPRHYLFLIPVAAIPAARIIGEYLESRKPAIQILTMLLGVSIISVFLEGNSDWKLYFPLTALFFLYYFVKQGTWNRQLFLLFFPIVLLLLPLEMIGYARQVRYPKQRELLKEQVFERYPDHHIFTDEVQKRLLEYYSGFKADQLPRFLVYEDLETPGSPDGKALLLLNGHTVYLSGMMEEDLPLFVRDIPPDIQPVFESKAPELVLYDMKDLSLKDWELSPLFASCNDFEGKIPFWKQNEENITKEIRYEGDHACLVSRYSSTFEYPLDSIMQRSPQDLLVSCTVRFYAEEESDARLVVSIEQDGTAVFWKALEMNRYIKAYSNWWPVSFEVLIPPEEMKPSSSLKVYVWKNDPPDVFIDDFCVSISEKNTGALND